MKKLQNPLMARNKYCSNSDLLCEIFKMKSTGKISNNLGEMILMIARQLATSGSFHGYTTFWKEDMIMNGVETCLRYIHNFEPMKSARPNVFAYITTIIRYSFLNQIKREKKHVSIKDDLYNRMDFEAQCHFEKIGTFDYEYLADKKRKGTKKKTA